MPARVVPLTIVLALLVGTAAAFAVTERLKLEKAPITGTQVDKTFSPVCGCETRLAHIRFRLTRADRIRLTMIDADGRTVRTLIRSRRFSRGRHSFTWNGRSDGGRVVSDGDYRPRVELSRGNRTIVLPNPIHVDTVRPRVNVVRVVGGRSLRVDYRLSERGHALLFAGRTRVYYGRFQRPVGSIVYRPPAGAIAPLSIAAVDTAGNMSKRVKLPPPA